MGVVQDDHHTIAIERLESAGFDRSIPNRGFSRWGESDAMGVSDRTPYMASDRMAPNSVVHNS